VGTGVVGRRVGTTTTTVVSEPRKEWETDEKLSTHTEGPGIDPLCVKSLLRIRERKK